MNYSLTGKVGKSIIYVDFNDCSVSFVAHPYCCALPFLELSQSTKKNIGTVLEFTPDPEWFASGR